MTDSSQEDIGLARALLAEWDEGNGTSKSELERRTWGDGSSHGRRFDRFILMTLGERTTRRSKQTNRIVDLEQQLRGLGHHPSGTAINPWEEELQHSRRSCLAALRIWNDPTEQFRAGGFSLLFVTAWNALAIAILQKTGSEWRKLAKDGSLRLFDGLAQAQDTIDLVNLALPGNENTGARENIRFWLDIRNAVAHRYLPVLDVSVIPHAQAGLLNFERILTGEFGDEFSIGDRLSVPLQLSGFRDPELLSSLRALQAALPLDVQAILARAEHATPELLDDETFVMRVAFIPVVPASGRSPDAVAYFVRPGEVPSELEDVLTRYLVLPKVARGPRPNFGAKHVVDEVRRRIPFKFNTGDHAEVGRRLGVRSVRGKEDRTHEPQYAEWVTAVKVYLYSQRWIDRIVDELSDSERFHELTGKPPAQTRPPARHDSE